MQYICSEKPNYKEFCFSRGSTENPPLRHLDFLLYASLIADEQGCVGACFSDGVEEGTVQNHFDNFRFLFFTVIGYIKRS